MIRDDRRIGGPIDGPGSSPAEHGEFGRTEHGILRQLVPLTVRTGTRARKARVWAVRVAVPAMAKCNSHCQITNCIVMRRAGSIELTLDPDAMIPESLRP
jgi:hypothetical protein